MQPDSKNERKPYASPRVRELTGAAARRLLEDADSRGDQGATYLLELLGQAPQGPNSGLRRARAAKTFQRE